MNLSFTYWPKLEAEGAEIDPFAGFFLFEIAAIEADAQVDVEAGDLVGVIVAVLIGVAFEEPAVEPAFFAGARGFFLPALEEARHVEHRLLPDLDVGDLHAQFIGRRFEMNVGELLHLVEEPMFESGGAPGDAERACDPGGFELEAEEFDLHIVFAPVGSDYFLREALALSDRGA